jgi:hypothetical protein
MKKYWIIPLISLLLLSCRNDLKIQYTNEFKNINHPEIGYWFFTPDMCNNERYLSYFDSIAKNSPFDLLFLTAREGCDFYNYPKMKPIFHKLVERAHQRGIKIGLQLWNYPGKVEIKNCQRLLSENEITLDANGNAHYEACAKHIRPKNFYKTEDLVAFRTNLFRAFAFKKLADGVYEPKTLKDITAFCHTLKAASGDKATILIKGGKELAGYTVYVMVEHFYNHPDMYAYASQSFAEALREYADVKFDGTALDEFGYMRITPPWEMKPWEMFSERFYSPEMGRILEKKSQSTPEMTLFNARYSPQNEASIRMKAINEYMDVLRQGPLNVEKKFYTLSKELFGANCFVGIHNTFHNKLDGDEIWMTGANWWTLPRDYGQTDETSALPTQLGIAFAHSQHVLYNQYYHPNPDTICQKALTDLRYGIRTHYHAFNDKQWGIGLESPELLKQISKVEVSARLLNRFNPASPETKLLVVFGTEALTNWFPDSASRSAYNLNNKLQIEEKAIVLLKTGYMNALVPSDLIENGKLTLNGKNKPSLNGQVFDAVVYLYPQFAKEKTLHFLEQYASTGGKLMLEGVACNDFYGNNISVRFEKIRQNATVKQFDIQQISNLMISKNTLSNGCYNTDGSVVLTDYKSLKTNTPTAFSVQLDGMIYSGSYIGMLAFMSENGKLSKITSSGLLELKQNDRMMLKFDAAQTLFYEVKGDVKTLTIADKHRKCRPTVCKL